MNGLAEARRAIGLLLALGGLAVTGAPIAARAEAPLVLRAQVVDEINPVTAHYMRQEVGQAEARRAALLLVIMNTPGGISTSMDEITTALLNSKVPVAVYISPAGARGDSAGLFVAQSADILAMAPGTNLGSAHPIAATGADLGGDLGRKVLNDAVARIRNLAELHRRNPDWCERAVRESVNIGATEAVSLHVADLEARSEAELLSALDGRRLTRPNGDSVTLNLAGATVEDSSMPWYQRLLHALINPDVAFLLLLLAIFGLVGEVLIPGAILPGTVGVISGLLALISLSSLPVNLGAALLLVFALVLFVVDIKAATHGVLTAGGVIALLLGGAFLVDTGPVGLGVNPLLVTGAALVTGAFFAFVVGKALTARSRSSPAGADALVGSLGLAEEDLDPEGSIWAAGSIWPAVSVAGRVPAGATVKVLARHGMVLEVALAES